ncbi:DHA2 family efflux MFS transporter permease subunit [Altererythrobacter sp. Root672]|uniref:DHA2 family efflux MFS transporter permease subunit n=1 Tax=Altererythrobacter sp. Root672 TaxID=1736584 RepID=UPI0006F97EE6|nr:DHA2 family efflux MFS transporter permease subunit [Altererythrobacter sp. Root672]KRA83118.1 disulfide bond formation protein DsbA [Altererythrobacter sp. Root672]
MATKAARAPAGGQGASPEQIDDVAHLPVENQFLLVIGIMTASLIQVLDTTIANVAIPHMQSSLGATPDTVTWVLTSYIIASAVAMPITGWLADRVGSRRLFIWSVAGFVVASMLCGMAQNLEEMVIFRALQGVAGAFIAPLSQSSLLDTTKPSRQSQMIALWGMGVMIGPILGPVLGGWITENWSWRWVFYVNVPVGVLCLVILLAQLPSREVVKRRFDLFGFAMIALTLSSLQLLLDRGAQLDWFSSLESWIYLFLIVSCSWIAVIHFATAEQPLFDRQLFANVNFVVALVFMVVIGAVMFATMALLPPMLQGLFGYDVVDTGMVLMPRGVGVLISMQLSGLLMRKGVDARWMVSIGFMIGAWSLYQMAGWSLGVDRYHIVLSGLLQGLGIGLVFIPLQATAFATLSPRLRTDGSSLLNLTRSVGSSIGISVMVTLLTHNAQTSHSDLAAHITPAVTGMIDLSSLERFHQYGEAALGVLDAEVTRQAAMIAYVNDYWLMMWLSLASVPLVLLMRRSSGPAARPEPPSH